MGFIIPVITDHSYLHCFLTEWRS